MVDLMNLEFVARILRVKWKVRMHSRASLCKSFVCMNVFGLIMLKRGDSVDQTPSGEARFERRHAAPH